MNATYTNRTISFNYKFVCPSQPKTVNEWVLYSVIIAIIALVLFASTLVGVGISMQRKKKFGKKWEKVQRVGEGENENEKEGLVEV